MPFPAPPGFKIHLDAQTPTEFTADDLKKQLEAVGLNCSQLTEQNLKMYIESVTSTIPEGEIQSYAILAPPQDLGPTRATADVQANIERQATRLAQAREAGSPIHYLEAVGQLAEAAKGNWSVVESTVDQGVMQVLQVKDHFDWLMANNATNGFPGIVTGPKTHSQYDTNETAVKSLFNKVVIEMAAAVVKGIVPSTMQATVSNIVQEQVQASENYTTSGSRVLHLVDGYDPVTRVANGIGTLTVKWDLSVANYKRKTKDGGDKHQTDLTVTAWSVLYTDPKLTCKNYSSVLEHFNIDPSSAPTCLS